MNWKRVWQLYRLIDKNKSLSLKRHPLFEQNRVMKVFGYIFIAFWAVYLMLFGVFFAQAFDGSNYESFDRINGSMLVFLVIDFAMRFSMQETPAQDTKPYKLLPVPQQFLLNVFLLRIGLSTANLFWGFFFVPFGLLAVVKFYGFAGYFAFLLGWWLMFVLNSYWYLLWRTLIQRSLLFLLIPIAIYAALFYFGIFYDEQHTWLFDFTVRLGRGFCTFQPWTYLLPLALIVLLFFVNRRMQYHSVYREIAQVEHVSHVRPVEMSWLNRFGVIGEYMKLEIKSTMRNKIVRNQFIMGVCYMLLFCCLFAFTDVYDDQPFMRTFICVYCFACLGTMTLTTILCVEGNYIDLLMSRHESVLSLLKAKYYFNCLMLLFPMLFALLPILRGKVLLVEALACAFFTMGCVFPFLFQLAVYNKSSLPMNQKITRNNSRSTKTQIIFSFAALFVPMFVMYALIVMLDTLTASWILLSLGLAGFLLNPLWLRNIYRRFMLRRYENMEGFRSSINH